MKKPLTLAILALTYWSTNKSQASVVTVDGWMIIDNTTVNDAAGTFNLVSGDSIWGGGGNLAEPNDWDATAHWNASGTGADTATWTFLGLKNGIYEVAVSYATPHNNRATDAPYSINGGTPIRINQETVAAGTPTLFDGANNIPFDTISTDTVVTDGTLEVVLSDDANEFVIADVVAIRLVSAFSALEFELRSVNETHLEFTWNSQTGKVYDLLNSVDPEIDGDPGTWSVVAGQEGLAATPPSNMRTIPLPDDDRRLYVVRERDAPPAFSDDFETVQSWSTGPNGGDTGNTVWERGAPGNFVSAGQPPLTGANGSTNCFGTNLAADYGASTDIYLRSPSIDLTAEGLTEATLTLYHYLDTEFSTDDVGSIRVLKASDFTPLGADLAADLNGIPNNNTDWQEVSYALPAAALGETVVLEFQFVSDADEHYSGWYIDDVTVTVK